MGSEIEQEILQELVHGYRSGYAMSMIDVVKAVKYSSGISQATPLAVARDRAKAFLGDWQDRGLVRKFDGMLRTLYFPTQKLLESIPSNYNCRFDAEVVEVVREIFYEEIASKSPQWVTRNQLIRALIQTDFVNGLGDAVELIRRFDNDESFNRVYAYRRHGETGVEYRATEALERIVKENES